MRPQAHLIENSGVASTGATGGHWLEQFGTKSLMFVLLHAPFALAAKFVSPLATAHGFLTIGLGVWFVWVRKSFGATVAVMAYIVGAEGFWRMTGAGLLWEFGKYSIAFLSLLGIVRQRTRPLSPQWLVYIALMAPAALLTVLGSDFSRLHEHLSFNMSGPVCLGLAGTWMLQQGLTRGDGQRLLICLVAPLVCIASLTLYGVRVTEIQFGEGSSMSASGGFGPNQVAAALALGMVACFLLIANDRSTLVWKITLVGLMLWMGAQGLLTMSRSAIYYSVLGMLGGMVFLVRDPRRLLAVAAAFGVAGLVFNYVLAPKLDEFTDGALTRRYQRKDLSGRETLMQGDLILFMEHPLLGVGPGMAKALRKDLVGKIGYAHTEFTRMLSEHGAFGLVALIVMTSTCVRGIFSQPAGWSRAVASSAVCYAYVFMSGSAMRMAIPAFLMALSGTQLGVLRGGGLAAANPPMGAGQSGQRGGTVGRVRPAYRIASRATVGTRRIWERRK